MGLQSVCDGGFGSAKVCCSAITDTIKSVFNNESASHYSLHVFVSVHFRKLLFKARERESALLSLSFELQTFGEKMMLYQ